MCSHARGGEGDTDEGRSSDIAEPVTAKDGGVHDGGVASLPSGVPKDGGVSPGSPGLEGAGWCDVATFPVHKYVLQRSCLHRNTVPWPQSSSSSSSASKEISSQHSTQLDEAAARSPRMEGTGEAEEGLGFAHDGGLGGAVGARDGEWETVFEAPAGAPTSFVDSGLAPGRTYVYR